LLGKPFGMKNKKSKYGGFIKKIIKTRSDALIVYSIIIVAAALASIGSSYITTKIKSTSVVTPQPQIEKPSDYPDYDAIKGKNPDPNFNVTKFTDGCPKNGCIHDKPASQLFDGIKKNYHINGNIQRAYLYIEAAVDYNRPLSNYDDFYISIKYQGGHLITPENLLPVPPSDISRYLYDMRSISYSYKGKSYKNVNFLNLLQNGVDFNLHTAVSSDRPGRVLKEVSIYYQCANNSDCNIEEIPTNN